MSAEDTKPGAIPVEPAANEVDDAKTLEGTIDIVAAPAEGTSNDDKDVKQEAKVEVKEESMQEDAAAPAAAATSDEKPVDVKTEDLKLSDSEREDKIVEDAVKQITFYFSDSNLPYDKFLFHRAQDGQKDPDAPMGTGWVSLSTVLSFKRMQEIISRSARSATICEFAIVNALRAAYPSKDESALIEISSDGNDIRRKQPLKEPGKTDQISRSVYVKGFPAEDEKSGKREDDDRRGGRGGGYVSSQLQKDLEKYFEGLGIGKVNAVRMRRDETKGFKGSVFVEFATIESAQALVDMDPKPTYPGEKDPIEVMFKKDYIDMKAKEKGIAPEYRSGNPNRNATPDSRSRRPFNAFKDYRPNGSASRDSKPQNVTVYVEGKEMEVDTETGNLKHPEEFKFTSGKIMKFEVTKGAEDFNPFHFKQALQTVHPAAFIDSERGSTSGIAFFKEPVTEDILKKIKETDLKVGSEETEVACNWTLLEGEEEQKFQLERANKRASMALADSRSPEKRDSYNDRRGGGRDNRGGGRGRGGGGGGGRGGRGGNRGGRGGGGDRGGDRRQDNRYNDRNNDRNNDRKRGRDDEDNNSPAKAKTETSEPVNKGNAISVPQLDSAGPSAAKKAKQEE